MPSAGNINQAPHTEFLTAPGDAESAYSQRLDSLNELKQALSAQAFAGALPTRAALAA